MTNTVCFANTVTVLRYNSHHRQGVVAMRGPRCTTHLHQGVVAMRAPHCPLTGSAAGCVSGSPGTAAPVAPASHSGPRRNLITARME